MCSWVELTMRDWTESLLFDAGYLSSAQRNWIAFIVSLACFLIASYFAKQVKSNPRLFTVMALFSGALVAIASSYEVRNLLDPSDVRAILANRSLDLASFLMV